MSVALVLVSHSAQLAAGLAEVAAQMAPNVDIRPAGGTDDGRIGTSFDFVEQSVTAALAGGADGVVVLTDLGSATLTAESVLELLDDDRVVLADAPFVEAALAAGVAANGGGSVADVAAAARTAIDAFAGSAGAAEETPSTPSEAPPADGGVEVSEVFTLQNKLGLHARPAATLARKAAEFEATVTLNGVDAASVLALMALGLKGGAEVTLVARGPQAAEAIEAIGADIDAGFGED